MPSRELTTKEKQNPELGKFPDVSKHITDTPLPIKFAGLSVETEIDSKGKVKVKGEKVWNLPPNSILLETREDSRIILTF